MPKLRALMLLGFCFAAPAQAGLFSDDDARNSIQQLGARVLKLEAQDKQQTQSIFDLQGQIEGLNSEIRKLRGQSEEIAHGLQDAEKREKDFYVDLDTRLRHFESVEASATAAATKVSETPVTVNDPDDPTAENHAIEAAYALAKAGNNSDAIKALREFLKKYPDSVHVPNATYWLGNALFATKDYKGALVTYRSLLKSDPGTSKAPDVYFSIAGCQRELKAPVQYNATLKQLITNYPDSVAATKAKELLSTSK